MADHDLTAARKGARTSEDAAAIAWAQDEIERLRKTLEHIQGVAHANLTMPAPQSDEPDMQQIRRRTWRRGIAVEVIYAGDAVVIEGGAVRKLRQEDGPLTE